MQKRDIKNLRASRHFAKYKQELLESKPDGSLPELKILTCIRFVTAAIMHEILLNQHHLGIRLTHRPQPSGHSLSSGVLNFVVEQGKTCIQ